MTLANRIAVMRDGVVQQLAPPAELYHRPKNLFVAGFIGAPAINQIEGEIEIGESRILFRRPEGTIDVSGYTFAAPARSGPATLGVRPEHIQLGSLDGHPASVEATISVVEPMGADVVVWTEWGSQTIALHVRDDRHFRVGDRIRLGLNIERISLFGADGERL
jgi:multiple sugar transport system ATP-binding protein